MDIKLISAVIAACIAALSALSIAFLNWKLARSNDQSSKINELKTQSYIDFINSISELAYLTSEDKSERRDALRKLADSKSRIAIYGDSSVIKKLAEFDRNHKQLNTDKALDAFTDVVNEMRVGAVGNDKADSVKDLKQIIFG